MGEDVQRVEMRAERMVQVRDGFHRGLTEDGRGWSIRSGIENSVKKTRLEYGENF